MTLNHALLVANLACAILVLHNGLFHAINNMSSATDRWIRFGWILLTTAAFGILVGPVFGYFLPTMVETVLNVGVVLYVLNDRRRSRADRRKHDRSAHSA